MTNDEPKERLPDGARPESGPTLAGDVVGHGLFRLASRDVAVVRKRPGPVPEGWGRVPPSLLRYSDEQTVAGVAAVFTAMQGSGLAPDRFDGWGVVAASRFLGRAGLAQALRCFDAEGVWGVSPHLIPHFALHSPAGTISLALGLHGPNLGVGGGLHASAEGFLAALTWLSIGVVPGVWLILSGWSPELIADRRGGSPAASECWALALALVASGPRNGRPGFRVIVGAEGRHAPAPIDLASLAETLERRAEPAPRPITTDPSGQLRVELVPGNGRTTEDEA